MPEPTEKEQLIAQLVHLKEYLDLEEHRLRRIIKEHPSSNEDVV